MRTNKKGFTLIELLAVIVILAIIMVIAVPQILNVIENSRKNDFYHDRFIIIDRKRLFHCGASFKDLGNKCFEKSKIEENDILENLLKKLSQ